MVRMFSKPKIEALLQCESSSKVQGVSEDHEIKKAAGRVFRNRQYRVYTPVGYDKTHAYPLVMVLHGCRQNHRSIQDICGFDAIADREQFIVVYPFVTSYSGLRTENCWGWWLSRQRQRGRGEVADLVQIACDVSNRYSVDRARWHICGLSAGAAMSIASLAAYGDVWRSGASVAGVPYGESMRSVAFSKHLPVRRKSVNTLVRMLKRQLITEPAPLMIIQSSADQIVGPKLGQNLRDVWILAAKCRALPALSFTDKTGAVMWQFDQYQDRSGQCRVAYLLMDKVEHGWSGGLPGNFSIPDAPNVSRLIIEYFFHSSIDRAISELSVGN